MEITTERLKFADVYPDEAGKVAQRLHTKKDEIPFVRKHFVVKEPDEVSKSERSLVSRISCSNKDREGESLLPSGVQLDNYRANPIVVWGHMYSDPKYYVGKNLWIKEDENGLIAKTVFAKTEFADNVFRAYTEDVEGTGPLLKGFSVGFIPLEWEDGDTKSKDAPRRVYTKWELLEYSCVGIPCSPESLTMAEEKGIISKRFKERIEREYRIVPDEPAETVGDLIEEKLAEAEAADVPDEPLTATEEAECEPDDHADLAEEVALIKSELAEIKEGRVLSTANRALVKSTIDTMSELLDVLTKLYEATDPTPRQEEPAERSVIIEADAPIETVGITPEKLAEIVDAAVSKAVADYDMSAIVTRALRALKGKCD